MVSATILAGIFGLLGTAFFGFIILTLWIWRYSSSLGGDDEDRIVELESEQESIFSAELADLYSTIEGHVEEEEDDMPDEVPREEFVVEVIERKIGEEDLASVVEELDSIGVAEGTYDLQEENFRQSYRNFGITAVLILMLGISIVVATITEGDPFTGLWNGFYILIIFVVGNFGYDGVKAFNEAESHRTEFESMWRSYKRVD